MTNLEILALLHKKTDNLIDVYRDRKFASPHAVNRAWRCIESYQHIKQSQRNYIMFDIDKIEVEKVKLLFKNKFFTPNFYIYEYSHRKNCFTLQVFLLLETYKITENFIKKYKKFCLLFGSDINYQCKTGIHKNPAFSGYENITIDEHKISIIHNTHVGYIHSRVHNFNDLFDKFERANFFENLPSLTNLESSNDAVDAPNQPNPDFRDDKLNIKIKAIAEVKKSTTAKPSNKEIGTRNITVFNRTREIVYSMSDKSLETILHIARKFNSEFKTPLKNAEIKHIALSIYKFITENFNNAKSDPYSEPQRAKSIEVRKKSAISKIEMAIIVLKRKNKNVSVSAIKKLTNQNIHTIRDNFNVALLAAENYEKNKLKSEQKQEKRSRAEFKKMVSVVFNKPIRKRKSRSKDLVKPAPIENLEVNKVVVQGIDCLMPKFDTSCDFIFNN